MGRGRAKRLKQSIGKHVTGSKSHSEAEVDGGEESEAATYPSVLSPELMAQLGVEHAEDAVAPVKLKGKKRKRVNRETKELAESISKSKAKKLKQLEEKKVKDGRRAELYRKLNSNSLAPEQLSLLQSSKTISQSHETLRSRMKQAVQRAVAGIKLESDILAELESHSDLVADIEELLALPVGGALAAVRKTQVDSSKGGVKESGGTAGSKAGKLNTVSTANLTEKSGAKRKAGKEAREEKAMATTVASKEPSVVLPAVAQSHTSRSTVVANAKRARERARAAPPPVEVVSIRPGSPSSDSEVVSDSGDDDEEEQKGKSTEVSGSGFRYSDDAGDDEAHAPGGEEGSDGSKSTKQPKVARQSKGSDPTDGHSVGMALQGSVETLARDKPDKDSMGATSAASWAEKMMSSLSRFPTASKASTPAANHDPSDASESSSELKTMPSPMIKGDNLMHIEDSVDSKAAADGASGGDAAPVHYPPLPDWVQGNAAPYVAVATPLPSASGGSTAPFPRPKRWIPVKRSVELQAARMQLPVCGMEQEIVEAIHDNDAVILCGETGSGKSTQVPQFLYEAGYGSHGLIGVTQPRRVAAVTTAERVAVELGTRCGRDGEVAYQIRYDASGVGPRTRVKFMTDGVLLQEITSDILLRKYSVVLLDEAHERNLNTDVLLGMLSRSIPLRKKIADEEQRAWSMLSEESKKSVKLPSRPLKLVIMSATLRVSDFTENLALFPTPPPVITAKSRQHPVTVHFNRRTELYDYVGETFRKVCKVHQRLPDGGILVFLTGKREILHMCHKLRKEFPPPKIRKGNPRPRDGGDRAGRASKANTEKLDTRRRKRTGRPIDSAGEGKDAGGGEGGRAEAVVWTKRVREISGGNSGSTDRAASLNEKPRETNKENLLYREADDDEEDAARLADMEHDQSNLDGDEDVVRESVGEEGEGDGDGDEAGDLSEDDDPGVAGFGLEREEMAEEVPPVHVVPLYAMLTAEEQAKVFRSPPDGHRLIVVATNVAETSITIPGISYVVDCGRQKRRVIQRGSGISKFEVGWISKASADQRAGRAGRTGPGHCYRLYSSALYTDTMEAFAPPEVLTRPLEDVMLQMKSIGIGDVSRFPFPTAPDAAGLRAAAALLASLGATANLRRRGQNSPSGVDGSDDDQITAVGKALALLPVGVRYAKMILLAVQGGVLAHAIAMVAMLTEGDPCVRPDGAVAKGGGDGDDGSEGDRQGGRDSDRVGHTGESRGASTGLDEDEARRRRAQWLHPTSDALARLKAAGAYAHATSGGTAVGGGEFCRENFLHAPTMERALNLRLQLTRLANLRFGSEEGWEECRVSKSLRPPDGRQTDALRQVLLSGLLDNVARRAPPGTVTAGSRLQRNYAYLSCNEAVKEPLYIKNTSVLFSRELTELPEWVVYQDIVRGEHDGAPARMTCVTAIEPSWLPSIAADSPLLSFSGPLVSPSPTYDEAKHTIMCRVTPRYGVHAWELPSYSMEMVAASPPQKPDLVFRWFGRLLLEGRVKGLFSSLKADGILNDPPSLLTRELPSKKALVLLLELRQKGVSSLPALAEQWRSNRSYLRTSLRLWIKVGCGEAFERAWSAARSAVLQMEQAAREGDAGTSCS